MQTKHQVELLLAKAGRLPNKALGQHFLIDLNLMRLLIDTAAIEKDDVVIEIGCGTGSLTEAIAEKAGSVIGIEYDKALTEILAARFSGANNVRIINGDALSSKNAINPHILEAAKEAQQKLGGRLLLVANLPYNIASAVMINLTCGPAAIDAMFVTGVIPFAMYLELSSALDIQLVAMSDDLMAKYVAKNPGWSKGAIPGGSYANMPDPIATTVSFMGIATHSDVPDDVVYTFTKAVFEHRQNLVEGYPAYRSLVPDTFVNESLKGLPMHPGAEKFWKEKGMM